MKNVELEFSLEDFLSIFSELLQATDEIRKVYWFLFERADGISITMVVSVYDRYVGITLRTSPQVAVAGFHLKNCSIVRVLDLRRRCFEVVTDSPNEIRCVICLEADIIVDCKNVDVS